MSSFLVNSFMMLLTSLGLCSYLSQEFETFLRFTACQRIYKYMLSNARLIKYVYQFSLIEFSFIIFFLLVTGYLLSIPSRKSKIAKLMQEKKKQRLEQNKQND